MRKPTEEDREELYEYMILFDMTDDRRTGREPHAVPERLMESFKSSKGFTYQEIASFGLSRNRDEPSNILEFTQYMDYVADRRYDNGEFARIGKMSNNMKLYLYYPSHHQHSNSRREMSQDSSQHNGSLHNSSAMEINREDARESNSKIDPFAIDKEIDLKPALTKYSPGTINEKVNILRQIFAAHFPAYYMKFTPFGSAVSGIAFCNSKLNINIEMDAPDMKRLLKESTYRGTKEPQNFNYMSVVLQSVGATKITYDDTLCSTSFLLDNFRYEYVFNREIVTKSTDLIEQYMKLDSRVLPFIKTLKYFGRGRNIFAPQLANNSIRFYAYVIMALSFLVSSDPPVIPNLQNINHKDIRDLCVSEDCATRKVFWETAIHKGVVVGATSRFHDCLKYDDSASPCTNRVKKNGSSLYWKSSNKATVGELFIDFMYYYGYEFDYKNFAVSLKMGGMTHRKDEFKDDLVVIEDPILSGVNLGAGIVDPFGLQKFQNTLRGAFTLLYGNVPFEQVITKTPDIHQYNNLRGLYGKMPKYRPFMRIGWTPSTKTIALIGLPKIPEQDRERVCFCDRIRNLFISYGVVDRLIDLDYTVKQITFTDVKRNVKDIVIPTSFVFEGKKVYLVELYDSIIAEVN